MWGRWWLAAILALGAMPLTAGQEAIVAEGGWWKQVSAFRSSGEPITRLQITSRGRVRVRGERGTNRVSGMLTKRVKAPSAAAARWWLDPIQVAVSSQNGVVMVEVTGPESDGSDLTLDLTVPRQLQQSAIQTRWGDVEATELEGAVLVESGGGMVRLDAIGQDAVARTGGGEMRLGRIGGSVNCATGGGTIRVDTIGGNADFSTGGGEIWVREVKGALRASTAGGSIHIERAGAEVVANSGGGLIEVAHAGGPVAAATSGGSIEVGGGKNIQCESGAGSIRLKGASGTFRAATASGMILAEISPGASLGNSILAASQGDIIVYLPSNLAVTVRARIEPGINASDGTGTLAGAGMAGRIVSEFGEIQAYRDRRRGITAEGRINGGGALLELAVSGGSIYVRRLKP